MNNSGIYESWDYKEEIKAMTCDKNNTYPKKSSDKPRWTLFF